MFSSTNEIPEHYIAPLQTRDKQIVYLIGNNGWSTRRYDSKYYLFCFDVKIRFIPNFEFEHLLKLTEIPEEKSTDETWLADAKEVFAIDFIEETVFDFVLDDAVAFFFDRDCHYLPDGTEVKVKFERQGRSNGWICLTEFEGHNLVFDLRYVNIFEEWPDETVARLYQFVVMLKHDFAPAQIKKEFEYLAAHRLASMLEDIQTLEEITAASIGAGI